MKHQSKIYLNQISFFLFTGLLVVGFLVSCGDDENSKQGLTPQQIHEKALSKAKIQKKTLDEGGQLGTGVPAAISIFDTSHGAKVIVNLSTKLPSSTETELVEAIENFKKDTFEALRLHNKLLDEDISEMPLEIIMTFTSQDLHFEYLHLKDVTKANLEHDMDIMNQKRRSRLALETNSNSPQEDSNTSEESAKLKIRANISGSQNFMMNPLESVVNDFIGAILFSPICTVITLGTDTCDPSEFKITIFDSSSNLNTINLKSLDNGLDVYQNLYSLLYVN